MTSVKPSIGRAGAIMMASLLLSRFLGIIRDMIMAWRFGQNAETDAYRLAFQVPDLLFYLVAGGALSSAFIPVFSEYLHTDREEEAWTLFSSVTTLMSVAILLLIAVCWIFAEPLARLVAPGVDPQSLPLIAEMSRILLPAQFAFFIGGLMFGTLYSRQVFSVPGLGPNVYNLGIIFGALVISNFVVPGVMGMTWGALVGAILGNLVIPFWAMARMGSRYRPMIDLSHPGVRKVFKLMIPVVAGLSLPSVYGLVLQYFGTFYRQHGINTALDYANRLMQAPLGVFGQSLALAAFPALAQFYAQKRMDAFGSQLQKTLTTVVYLSVPVAALFFFFSEPVVDAFFQHGRFTDANSKAVAGCLQFFAIGVAPWCLQPVLMRAYFAVQNTVTPIVMGTITTLVFISLAATFTALKWSYIYLPLAGSIAAIVLVLMLVRGVGKFAVDLHPPELVRDSAKALTAAIAACLLPWLVWRYGGTAVTGVTGAASLALLTLVVLLVGWTYYAVTKALKMPQTAYIERALAKIGRPAPDQPAE
ncbi:MAG: Lipid II flippase MurJ [Fimbriimonadaceae bacterium]|nr:Lipid II flippase MurJ [Fimbriimonadaceae bacterium]